MTGPISKLELLGLAVVIAGPLDGVHEQGQQVVHHQAEVEGDVGAGVEPEDGVGRVLGGGCPDA